MDLEEGPCVTNYAHIDVCDPNEIVTEVLEANMELSWYNMEVLDVVALIHPGQTRQTCAQIFLAMPVQRQRRLVDIAESMKEKFKQFIRENGLPTCCLHSSDLFKEEYKAARPEVDPRLDEIDMADIAWKALSIEEKEKYKEQKEKINFRIRRVLRQKPSSLQFFY